MGIHDSKPTKRILAEKLDSQIKDLERIRDTIDPSFSPQYSPHNYSKFSRFLDNVLYWLDYLCTMGFCAAGLVIALIFLWSVICGS